MNMELMAMRWLRWERRCPIVLQERSPREWSSGRPDVLGVTTARFLIEIEIKRTVGDFRADQKKRSRSHRDMYLQKLPKQFYYLVPPLIVEKVKPFLPAWAGLMQAQWPLMIVTPAPVNRDSQKLTVKECCQMVHLISNHAISCEETLEHTFARYLATSEPWPRPDYEI